MKNVFKKAVAAVSTVAVTLATVFTMTSCFGGGFVDNSFKLGASGPLTGDAASYGISVQNGAKLAVEHINAKGGVQFSFVMKDDQAGAEEAGQNYDALYDAGMQASLGGVTSGAGEAFAEKANADGIFCMTPSGSADPVIANKPYSFRLCFGDPDQGAIAAQKIADMQAEGQWMTVGALYDSSDSYSAGIFAAFEDKMEELEISFTTASFTADTKSDLNAQATQLAGCDVVFMPFYYNEASLFIEAAVGKGSNATFFGCDGFDGIAPYITNVTNKVMYITPFDANAQDDQTKAFVAAYQEKYGATPDQFAADAYDVVMVIAAALEKAGCTDYTLSAQEISNILKNTVVSEDFSYDGLTGVMTWDASGACTKEPNIVEFN